MRKFNVSIPVPTKDDIASMATKAKDKVQDTNRAIKAKAVKAALNNEHTHDAMVEELAKHGIKPKTPITAEMVWEREAMKLLNASFTPEERARAKAAYEASKANTQTKEV